MLTPFEEELALNTRFADRYQIMSVVGRGSMGVVYKARHELMGRFVAIKMLRGQLQMDERNIKRFEREARVASRMDHPNLISVHDFGLSDHRQPYLIMDFASGQTLYEVLKREQNISPERAVHIFTQVCDALHHAHLQGVIHRDLKPSNIMLIERDGDKEFVKVFDMGIAKIAWGEDEEDKEAITNTGEVCGSPVYLSPEQCTHSALDARTDIYSLGVVMYEMIMGYPPLMGESVYDTIYMHVHQQPPSFKEMRPDLHISDRLERVVMKALLKDPDSRYQTMQELKWELQAALATSDPNLKVLPPEAFKQSKGRPKHEAPIVVREPGTPSTKTSLQNPIKAAAANYDGDVIPRVKAPVSSTSRERTLAPKPPERSNSMLKVAVMSGIASAFITLAGVGMFFVMNSNSQQKSPLSNLPEPGQAVVHQNPAKTTLKHRKPVASHEQTSTPNHFYSGKFPISKAPAVKPHVAKATPANHQPTKAFKLPESASTTAAKKLAQSVQQNNFFSIFMPGHQQKAPGVVPQQLLNPNQPSQAIAQTYPHQRAAISPATPISAPSQPNVEPPAWQPNQPSSVEAVIKNNLGVRALAAGNYNEAISLFKTALQIDPQYKKAKVNLGRAFLNEANRLRRTGDAPSAKQNYKQAVEVLTATLGPNAEHTTIAKDDYKDFLREAGAAE